MNINISQSFKTSDGKDLLETGDFMEFAIDLQKKGLKEDEIVEQFRKFWNGQLEIIRNPITLKKVLIRALETNYEDERNTIKAEEKAARWALILDIQKAGDIISLTPENVTLLRKLVGKSFGVIIVGQAWEMLDPKETAS